MAWSVLGQERPTHFRLQLAFAQINRFMGTEQISRLPQFRVLAKILSAIVSPTKPYEQRLQKYKAVMGEGAPQERTFFRS